MSLRTDLLAAAKLTFNAVRGEIREHWNALLFAIGTYAIIAIRSPSQLPSQANVARAFFTVLLFYVLFRLSWMLLEKRERYVKPMILLVLSSLLICGFTLGRSWIRETEIQIKALDSDPDVNLTGPYCASLEQGLAHRLDDYETKVRKIPDYPQWVQDQYEEHWKVPMKLCCIKHQEDVARSDLARTDCLKELDKPEDIIRLFEILRAY